MALTREQMAQRGGVARELQDGYYVNLGIGIPTLVANYVPASVQVMLQSENGPLGMDAFPTEEDKAAGRLVRRWQYSQNVIESHRVLWRPFRLSQAAMA